LVRDSRQFRFLRPFLRGREPCAFTIHLEGERLQLSLSWQGGQYLQQVLDVHDRGDQDCGPGPGRSVKCHVRRRVASHVEDFGRGGRIHGLWVLLRVVGHPLMLSGEG
jgi:hypothetical protein